MRNKDTSEELLVSLPKNLQEYVGRIRERVNSEEDYIKSIMAGYCPHCSSDRTIDGYKTPLNEITVAICLDCYTLWCLECGEIFDKGQTVCGHWDICDKCAAEANGGCEFPPFDCSVIKDWQSRRGRATKSADSGMTD